jgi:hypothetical protein
MPVRCTHCGYENDPQYRFCGMCGVAMPQAGPAGSAPPQESSSPGISGPSFLGLAENPKRSVEYLLEEEPPSSHWRMYLALALLIVSAGLLVWHWRRDGYPWAATPVTQSAPSVAGSVAAPAAEATSPAETPATAVPAPHAANAPEQTAVSEPPAESKSEAASPPADSQTKPESAQGDNPAPAEPGSTVEDQTAAAAQGTPAETPPSAAPEPAQVERKPVAPPVLSYTDKLVADGERYLYGNGVPEDCSRAQKNLLSAARRANPKAEGMLGAMYTTGHCVPRDLPTAYHWFALALRHEPGNSRIEQDLEVVWKQMTPGEKQIALHNRQ